MEIGKERIRGVVFDFDGVIADSEPLHLATYQEVSLRSAYAHVRRLSNLLGYTAEDVFRIVAPITVAWNVESCA